MQRSAYLWCALILTLGNLPARAALVTATPHADLMRAMTEDLLREFNTEPSLELFIVRAFSAHTLAREEAKAIAEPFNRLKALGGQLTLVDWRQPQENMAEAVVRTERGSKYAKLVLFTSKREPGKITQIFILPERDPVRARADVFPVTALGDKELVQVLNRRLDALAEEDLFSGAVLVARDGDILLREARGMANRSWSIPNSPETRFNIASTGKMWTALIVLRLVEQGKLSLDDSLAKWVPEFPHADAANAMNLRMLLQHRGALAEWDGRDFRRKISPAEAAATMDGAPGEPGKTFAYSNAGYILLAAAAERASGQAYEDLVAEHVFQPAGMTQSGFWPVTAVVSNRATGYLRPPEDALGFGPYFSNAQYLGFGGDASGGAYSTLDDLFAFHRALAEGRLVTAETLQMMIDEQVTFFGAPRPTRYGLGLRLEQCAGAETLGHSGGGANSGVSTSTYASRDGRWTIIVLGNIDPMPDQLAFEMCDLVHRN